MWSTCGNLYIFNIQAVPVQLGEFGESYTHEIITANMAMKLSINFQSFLLPPFVIIIIVVLLLFWG